MPFQIKSYFIFGELLSLELQDFRVLTDYADYCNCYISTYHPNIKTNLGIIYGNLKHQPQKLPAGCRRLGRWLGMLLRVMFRR